MKKLFKRVSVLFAALMALSVSTVRPVEEVKAASYSKTSFGEGQLLITTVFNGQKYYLPATTTSSGPKAQSFTDVNSIGEEHLWTVTASGTNWYIQNSEGKYLYTTNDNNGVRVGNTNHAWAYDALSNSFKNTVTSRYLGIYDANNWRCYKTVNASNYKESSTSFVFYSIKVDASTPSVQINGDKYTEVNVPITLDATLTNTTEAVSWTSSDENVATIDSNGVVTPKKVGVTTITATVGEVSDTHEIKVYPVKNSNISIAEALKVCELTGETNAPYVYSTTGTIKSIDEAYNSKYGNITVTITDGTNSIKAYRMTGGSELSVGAKITVTGTLVNYYGNTPEFIAGCTYVTEQTNEQLIAVSDTKFSLSFDYSLSSNANDEIVDFTNQGYTNGQAISEYVGTSFNVSFAKGGNTNNAPKYYNTGTAIRLYAKNEFTVTSASTIVNITFGFGEDDSADNVMTPSTGSFEGSSWTGSANEIKFTLGDGGQRRFVSILVTTCDGELQESASFANVNLAFGASVNADLFEGYASVNGGILLENAANYTETTLAEAYANGSFEGIDTIKENLTPVDGFYTVGTVVEIINGLVNEENEKFLSYEFVAAAYFELVDAEGNVTTVVLQQKVYSVKSMVEYYNNNLSLLGIEDKNVIKALGAFEDYLA